MKTFEQWLGLGLWLAGAGHFCVLAASFQVPRQLRWKEELARLGAFNRKLMWTYGGFTVLTVVAFGALTLLLHEELLRGDRAAAGLAGFIAIYWSARIAVDFAWFGHSDWPRGRAFVVGHFLLTSLFVALALVYWAAVAWHFLKP